MEEIEKRVSELENAIVALIANVKEVNASIAHGFEKVDENFRKTNEKIDSITDGSKHTLKTVEIQLADLTTEISKINTVTQYGGIFDNMRIVKKDGTDDK